MEPELNQPTTSPWNRVTPLSKYLAMALFILLPFIGGWIGYHYMPEKVVEVEKVVEKMVEVEEIGEDADEFEKEESPLPNVPSDWNKHTLNGLGISFNYPPNFNFEATLSGRGVSIGTVSRDAYVGVEKDVPVIGIALYEDAPTADPWTGDSIKEMHTGGTEVLFEEFEKLDNRGGKYTYKFTQINGIPVLLHKRNYYGLIGNVYQATFFLEDGRILGFFAEEDNEILDIMYHSVQSE